jgi:hypothetical protein
MRLMRELFLYAIVGHLQRTTISSRPDLLPAWLYTVGVLDIIDSRGLNPLTFTDDTQIDGYCAVTDAAALQDRISVSD